MQRATILALRRTALTASRTTLHTDAHSMRLAVAAARTHASRAAPPRMPMQSIIQRAFATAASSSNHAAAKPAEPTNSESASSSSTGSGSSGSSGSSSGEESKQQSSGGGSGGGYFRSDSWTKTVGTIGAIANWTIPLAGITHMINAKDPATTIDPVMTSALAVYSVFFMRWALAITPANYPLLICHVSNEVVQLAQLGRYVNAVYVNPSSPPAATAAAATGATSTAVTKV